MQCLAGKQHDVMTSHILLSALLCITSYYWAITRIQTKIPKHKWRAENRRKPTLGLELKDELSTVGDVNVARRSTVCVGRQILDHSKRLLTRDDLTKHSVNAANNATSHLDANMFQGVRRKGVIHVVRMD